MPKKEIVFPLNTFGGRIQDLRKNRLKISRPEFYDLIYPNTGILNESKSRTVKHWESGHCEPDLDTILKICTVLKCSSDYLFGLDNCTTKDTQFIHNETGLSEDAINTLKTINFRANKQIGDHASKNLSILNFILKDGDAFEDFLSNLTLFIDNNYKTPIFWDSEKHCYIDTGYRYANGDIGVTFGYLTKDNKGNDGYSSLGVSVDILESHAMLQMQGIMKDWKDAHKKES